MSTASNPLLSAAASRGAAEPSDVVTLRERARGMGLCVWRLDRAGAVVCEPGERGPLGLWLACAALREMVVHAACGWAERCEPEPVELFPGCTLLPLPEVHRRERVGYIAALALGPAALAHAEFARLCASAQVDPRPTKSAALAVAYHDSGSARAAWMALRWMQADLRRAREDAETIAGFTRQLTDGFETIDLLYTLGRSMNDLSRPRAFVEMAADRLHGSMPFGWVCAWFGADAKVSAMAGPGEVFCGEPTVDRGVLSAAMAGIAAGTGGKTKAVILEELGGRPLPGSGQALVQPVTRGGRTIGLIICGDKRGDDPQVSSYDMHLLEAAAGYIGAFLDNAVLYGDQRAMFMGTLRAMTSAIDAKDRYTRGHSERVAHLSRKLALAAGLGEEVAERLHICGLVHDIGKIGVPEAVLGKPGRLTDEEFGHIKLHPEIGHRILRDIPLLEDVLPGVLHHHERADGRGYPGGLAGEAVPLFARIVALADTFDAMSSTRSYRSAMPRERVLAEIVRCAGTQFDAALAPVFVGLDFSEYDAMVARHAAAAGATAPTASPPVDAPAMGLAA
jgi:HD-GYP domain-containing protein (c-di-GMP phosphodiesterase class II)